MNLIYRKLLRPILFNLDAEHAHDWACRCLSLTERSNISRKFIQLISSQNSCEVNLFGVSFPNRLGLAAGMDKSGKFPKSIASLGFGHTEIGTITPKPQIGNPKPRLFRYPRYNALVNRMGFNNDGVETVIKRIESIYPKKNRVAPLGINIGKGKDTPLSMAHEDYLHCLKVCYNQADYITINISSPNTPNLRELHKTTLVKPLLEKLVKAGDELAKDFNISPVPLLLKISPDESYKSLENIVRNAKEIGFSGIIATNTSISRSENIDFENFEAGGLSGQPIEKASTNIIRFIAKLTDYKFPIIGAGGISSRDTALKKLDAGASLIQIYSSFVYEGPLFPSNLVSSLNHRNKVWI